MMSRAAINHKKIESTYPIISKMMIMLVKVVVVVRKEETIDIDNVIQYQNFFCGVFGMQTVVSVYQVFTLTNAAEDSASCWQLTAASTAVKLWRTTDEDEASNSERWCEVSVIVWQLSSSLSSFTFFSSSTLQLS